MADLSIMSTRGRSGTQDVTTTDINAATLSTPTLSVDGQFMPVTPESLSPEKVAAQVLKENRAYLKSLVTQIKQAHRAESCPELKGIKALETLVNASFRLASQGPDFLMPAIATFLEAGERCKDILGVRMPTIGEALCDVREHEARYEILKALRVHTEPLRSLTVGANPMSSHRSDKMEIHFGVPLIEVGVHLRLPIPNRSLSETVLLTNAFLTLMEETLHSEQSLRIKAQQRLEQNALNAGKSYSINPEDVLLSPTVKEFLRETEPHELKKISQTELPSRIGEIDVAGRLLELAEEFNFPKECLFAEFSQNHVDWRKGLHRWLRERGRLPNFSEEGTAEFCFVERGRAHRFVRPDPSKLSEEALELLQTLSETDTTVRRAATKLIRAIIADPSDFAELGKRAETLSDAQTAQVLQNLSAWAGKFPCRGHGSSSPRRSVLFTTTKPLPLFSSTIFMCSVCSPSEDSAHGYHLSSEVR